MKFFLLLIIFLTATFSAYPQVYGCTDPQATNFNAAATANDGSCIYNNQNYNPAFKASLPAALREISGMICFNGKLLAHNDGGGGPKLYFLDTTSGSLLQTITLEGASNIDWEDMAQDSSYVYIGDFGNNAAGNRQNLCIYKIERNAFNQNGDFTIPAHAIGKINFSYADQHDFSNSGSNNTRFDCEAMMVRRNRLHLFSKNWVGNYSVHYSMPTDTGTHVATRLDSLNTGNILITSAGSGGDDVFMLTGYNTSGSCAAFLVYGFDSTDHFFNSGNKRRFQLPSVLTSGQLESIAFVNATHGFIANEYFSQLFINVSHKLRTFNTLEWILDYYQHNPKTFGAVPGMLRYNSTTGQYEIFTGIQWEDIKE